MSTLSQFLGGGGIKSIQRGSTEFEGTVDFNNLGNKTLKSVPINPVDSSKSVVTATVAGDVIYDDDNGVAINSNASIKLAGASSFVKSTIQLEGTSQTLTGLESDDLVLFFNSSDNTSLSSISGWSALPFDGNNPDNNGGPNSSGFYKFADSSGIVQVTGIANNSNAMMVAFRGIDSSDPFDVSSIPKSIGFSGMPDPPSITTGTDNCMIVAVGFLDDDRLDILNSIPPSGYTFADVTSNADNSTILVAYKNLENAGVEDPGAFGGSGSDANKAYTIALKTNITTTSSSLVITVGGALAGRNSSGGHLAKNQTGVIDWQVIEYED